MRTLSDIENEIDQVNQTRGMQVEELRGEAMRVLTARLESEDFQAKIKALDDALSQSQDLTDVPNDEFVHRWVRFDASTLIVAESKLERELLKEYLQDNYSIELDLDNDVAHTAEGPVIAINDDGDVLDQDSGQWIVSRKDYETIAERNRLIEAYMERTGYFPSVVKFGRYGVEGYVNTQAKE